jgi:hypothetical protein
VQLTTADRTRISAIPTEVSKLTLKLGYLENTATVAAYLWLN